MKYKALFHCSLVFIFLLSQQSFAQGWDTLFNGQDFTGWSIKGKPQDVARNYWTVEDGTILAWATEGGYDYLWCYSDKEYQDFNLQLKFQSVRGDGCNSGTQYASRYDTVAMWLDGPQLDIESPLLGGIWDETRGSGRWLASNRDQGNNLIWSDTDPGWNQLEISVIDLHVTQKLNGVLITDYDGAGVLDDAVHKEHNVGEVGHIALQIHGGYIMKIRFKDIYIQDLTNPTPVAAVNAGAIHPFSLNLSGSGLSITANRPGFSTASILDMQGNVIYRTRMTGPAANWPGAGSAAHGAYIARLTGVEDTSALMFMLNR